MKIALVALAVVAHTAAAPARYVVEPEHSSVTIHVGKAGLFKFAGHEHAVAAPLLSGEIVADPERLEASRVELQFDSGALRVIEAGESSGDAPKVQERMLGSDVLDAARHPRIEVRSVSVSGRAAEGRRYALNVVADFGLHGVTGRVSVPVRVELDGTRLTAAGEFDLRQSEFGITPVSVAGVVKVKNELAIEFRIVAHLSDGAAP